LLWVVGWASEDLAPLLETGQEPLAVAPRLAALLVAPRRLGTSVPLAGAVPGLVAVLPGPAPAVGPGLERCLLRETVLPPCLLLPVLLLVPVTPRPAPLALTAAADQVPQGLGVARLQEVEAVHGFGEAQVGVHAGHDHAGVHGEQLD